MLIHGEQPALAVFPEAIHRDAIHAACPCVGLHFFPSELKHVRPGDFVDQAEPLLPFQPSFESYQRRLCQQI
jgi:hypothetical protein